MPEAKTQRSERTGVVIRLHTAGQHDGTANSHEQFVNLKLEQVFMSVENQIELTTAYHPLDQKLHARDLRRDSATRMLMCNQKTLHFEVDSVGLCRQ